MEHYINGNTLSGKNSSLSACVTLCCRIKMTFNHLFYYRFEYPNLARCIIYAQETWQWVHVHWVQNKSWINTKGNLSQAKETEVCIHIKQGTCLLSFLSLLGCTCKVKVLGLHKMFTVVIRWQRVLIKLIKWVISSSSALGSRQGIWYNVISLKAIDDVKIALRQFWSLTQEFFVLYLSFVMFVAHVGYRFLISLKDEVSFREVFPVL